MYRGLPHDIRLNLDTLIKEIMLIKQQMLDLVLSAGSSSACCSCGGECCRFGKYHVTVLDVLAYCATDTDPVIPDFSKSPDCPYSNSDGCLMSPRFRPMTCVVFNCDLVENLLSESDRAALQKFEQTLREAIARVNLIDRNRLDRPVLFVSDN
jgi:hypothetical protein